MSHPTVFQAFGSKHEQLARKLADLRYDELALLLDHLVGELYKDGLADHHRNRPALAAALVQTTHSLKQSASLVYNVWEVCKNHMEAEGGEQTERKDSQVGQRLAANRGE